jgi:hypothetical protein
MCYEVGWVSLPSEARQRNPTFLYVVGLRFLTTFKNLTQPTSIMLNIKVLFFNLMAVMRCMGMPVVTHCVTGDAARPW